MQLKRDMAAHVRILSTTTVAFSTFTLLVGRQEGHTAGKN